MDAAVPDERSTQVTDAKRTALVRFVVKGLASNF